MIARYITHRDLDLYLSLGWQCSYYGARGDDLQCYLAVFCCCEGDL